MQLKNIFFHFINFPFYSKKKIKNKNKNKKNRKKKLIKNIKITQTLIII